MESWLRPRPDDAPDDLACHYPLDGYEALGLLVNDMTTIVRSRLSAARRRRREVRMLRRAYGMPSYDVRR